MGIKCSANLLTTLPDLPATLTHLDCDDNELVSLKGNSYTNRNNQNNNSGYSFSNAFANTTNVHLDNKALNFMCYIISHGMALLTRTSCIMSVYSGKKNVQVKNFKYACEIHFAGELGELIKQRISEIEGLLANRKETKEEDKTKILGDDLDDEIEMIQKPKKHVKKSYYL